MHRPSAAPSESPKIMGDVGILALAAEILGNLKSSYPSQVPGMDSKIHYLAPHVPKAQWSALGDAITAREQAFSGAIDGNEWISLRLDGTSFTQAVRMMRTKGILEEGFSLVFADCMVATLQTLMKRFDALVGYTQSDEMAIFIPPASIVRGVQQAHAYNGRVTKLTTLAASFVTASFLHGLATHCINKGLGIEALGTVLPHFDCRLGHFASWNEASSLLLWRAYDCSVNGVSDAVCHNTKSNSTVRQQSTRDKLEWLHSQSKLPLPAHQAYGALFVRTQRCVKGFDPKRGVETEAMRSVLEQIPGPVLETIRNGRLSLCLEDDKGTGAGRIKYVRVSTCTSTD